jgi:EAL domain-containing protein (putative c-di-GMP-specific phosphodiesterase class I)
MVRSIIDLWRALEIKITAESVETKAHTPLLADLGCDRFQGYYFGRPAPFPDVLAAWWPSQPDRTTGSR